MIETLQASLSEHGFDLPPDQVESLDRYRALLWKKNESLNLTRHTTIEKFVTRDVADCLALERFLDVGEEILDVGTGGGVPGVMLSMLRPDLVVTVCDSVAKRAGATESIVEGLGAPVTVAHARAEDLLETLHYDSLVARAVAPLRKILVWFDPHWDSIGKLLLIKGRNWTEERAEARHQGLFKNLELRRLSSYETPGTGSQNVILRICRKEPM